MLLDCAGFLDHQNMHLCPTRQTLPLCITTVLLFSRAPRVRTFEQLYLGEGACSKALNKLQQAVHVYWEMAVLSMNLQVL